MSVANRRVAAQIAQQSSARAKRSGRKEPRTEESFAESNARFRRNGVKVAYAASNKIESLVAVELPTSAEVQNQKSSASASSLARRSAAFAFSSASNAADSSKPVIDMLDIASSPAASHSRHPRREIP